jgi:Transposase IS66 family
MSTEATIQIGSLTIPPSEQTPLVLALAEIIRRQDVEIKSLRDEIHKLKGTTQRPKIEPSRLLEPEKPKSGKSRSKRPGSEKRRKTQELQIHQDVPLLIEGLPAGTRIEGYRDFVVQDLNVAAHNTRYRRTVYRLPDGSLQVAVLPADVNGHFGVGLKQFVLYQVHQTHVSQARLLEQLQEYGIDISAGQVNEILLHGHDALHAEKDALLPTAREVSGVLHIDDTSARHRGRNAVCTHIGNELFASFHTTDSKSRLNFLQLLCQPEQRYTLNEEMLTSLELLGAPQTLQQRVAALDEATFTGREAFCQQLDRWQITSETHRTQVCEAALYGTLLTERWYDDLGLVSDDAPQFKLFGFVHGLCWVHAERKVSRLIPLTPKHKQAVEKARDQIWKFYKRLQAYRVAPHESQRRRLDAQFDRLFLERTGYPALNEALALLYAKRDGLLAVLDHPQLPLHNNLSENDIREYARLRKVSGGTRSDLGRRCRDTFLSLKKTCRKLGLSFWQFLKDRLTDAATIPPLADLLRQAAANEP